MPPSHITIVRKHTSLCQSSALKVFDGSSRHISPRTAPLSSPYRQHRRALDILADRRTIDFHAVKSTPVPEESAAREATAVSTVKDVEGDGGGVQSRLPCLKPIVPPPSPHHITSSQTPPSTPPTAPSAPPSPPSPPHPTPSSPTPTPPTPPPRPPQQ